MLLRRRDLVGVILLTFVTCGLYSIYLYFAMGSEIVDQSLRDDTETKPTSIGVAFLLTIVTFGIYGVYYIYVQAKALQEIGAKRNVSTLDPIVVLLLAIFLGFGMYFNVHNANNIVKYQDTSNINA